MGDTLKAGASLSVGESLISANRTYTVTLREGGDLVLLADDAVVWSSGTDGTGATTATLREDGNFVLTTDGGASVWNSGTAGESGVWLVLQNDRNLVLYEGEGQAVWSSHTFVWPPTPPPGQARPPVRQRAAKPAAKSRIPLDPITTADGATLVPVTRISLVGGRTVVGAFTIKDGKTTWTPAIDGGRVAMLGVLTGLIAATLGAAAVYRKPPWPSL